MLSTSLRALQLVERATSQFTTHSSSCHRLLFGPIAMPPARLQSYSDFVGMTGTSAYSGIRIEARPDRGGKMRTRKLRMQRKVKRQQTTNDSAADRPSNAR